MIARLKPKKRIKMNLMKMVLRYISSIRAVKNLRKVTTMISLVKAIKTSLIIIYKRRQHRMLGIIMEMRWAMTMMMRNNLLTSLSMKKVKLIKIQLKMEKCRIPKRRKRKPSPIQLVLD